MFYVLRTHQNLRQTPKHIWKFHFLSIEPIKRCKKANEPIRLLKKWNEPIKMLHKWNAPNKSKEEGRWTD